MPSFQLKQAPRQMTLVNGLREVSGLAMASETSVYAHNDEFGIVYEVSLEDGAVKSAFALGDPTVSADFEGIAAENGGIYLITSAGLLYEALIGAHRGRVLFNVFDTGVGSFCEVEGLARGLKTESFLILCKTPQVPELQGKLTIYQWSLRNRRPVVEPWLQIPYKEFLSNEETDIFRPSAIEWDPLRQVIIILSARSRHLAVITEDGETQTVTTLPEKLHLQAEGVALARNGDLVIADEGAGRGAGKLSIYSLQP